MSSVNQENSNSKNYYEQQKVPSIEKVILAENITLPELPSEELTLEYFKYHSVYKLAMNEYNDIKAKFFMPVMTPMKDQEKVVEEDNTSPSSKGQLGESSLQTDGYSTSNCIELVIPKYILLEFVGTIPQGTEFLMASVGGNLNVSDMRIVGLYSTFEGLYSGRHSTSSGSSRSGDVISSESVKPGSASIFNK